MQQVAGLENARRSSELRPRRVLRRVLLAATCLLVLALLGMYGSTVYFIHKAFTRRVQACKTVPEDLGLKAETIDLTSSIVPGADHLIFTEDGIGKGQADSDYRKHILEFLGKVRRQSGR